MSRCRGTGTDNRCRIIKVTARVGTLSLTARWRDDGTGRPERSRHQGAHLPVGKAKRRTIQPSVGVALPAVGSIGASEFLCGSSGDIGVHRLPFRVVDAFGGKPAVRGLKGNGRQARAAGKGVLPDGERGRGDGDLTKRGASRKHVIAEVSELLRKGDGSKRGAVGKGGGRVSFRRGFAAALVRFKGCFGDS